MTFESKHLADDDDILIVDDALENLKFLQDVLIEAGFHVRPASDGELALISVQTKLPALILLDIRMSGMDGFEVCRRLKADPATRNIPIIFATALTDTAEKIKGFELGAVDYVTKPLNAQEVVMRVKTHLSLSGALKHLEIQNIQLREAEIQMRQAKDIAEAANRAKTVFLSNISHELRTPLNAILGFAQILEHDSRLPEDARQNIATINRAGNHLLALINDVLEISRIEAGRVQIENEIFDLIATVQTLQEMIQSRAESKGLKFVVNFSQNLPPNVKGDVHHLRQVLMNLLGNAVKYTDFGEVRLNVNRQSEREICFEVIDTGPGIAEEEQERIFQPFYQTEIGIAKGEGTGLGLAISHEFVRLMGGDLTLESTEGQGCTFRFTLLLPPVASEFHEIEISSAVNKRIVTLAAGQVQPRILLAEDRVDNQQVVKQFLEQIGCEVAIAANGQEAVNLFQHWQPHLILMDMRMPVMDGYQATRIIRSLPNGDKLPILALTASAFDEDHKRVLATGCNEIITKPVDAQHLYSALGQKLGLRFEYEKPQTGQTKSVPTKLMNLPIKIRKELTDVAQMLDTEAIEIIVENIRPDYPYEAMQISELSKDFRFDKILELLKPI